MTKQEKIQEAYGEYFEEIKPWINENGWFDKNSFYKKIFSFNYGEIDVLFSHCKYLMTPKSIIGIENNNGWVNIESEADLPTIEYELYFVNGDNCSIHQCVYHEGIKDYWLENLTHYQPIQKPQPPIY